MRLFITGTSTDIGKTAVGCALVRATRARGLDTIALKPIETGCDRAGGTLYPSDGARLADAADGRLSLDEVCPFRFEPPLAPSEAARITGAALELATVVERVGETLATPHDLAVIEGAGGLLVPIDHSSTMADLAAALDARLLIVAAPSLGTINHTLLTIEACAARSLPVAGLVFSERDPTPPQTVRDNARVICERLDIDFLGTLPNAAGPADTAHTPLDIDALLAALARPL